MGGWPGRRRRFRRGMLKYVVLQMLESGDRHGYELMRRFAERGWGRLGAGTLYPVLAMLEEQGYVESREIDGKRRYRITEKGRQQLREMADDLETELEDGGEESAWAPDAALQEAVKRLMIAVMPAAQNAKPETVAKISERIDALRKEVYTILANE